MRQFRNIPPLQYLLGFEAAARLGSFGKAAEELGLTQSAISHQIRLLEDRIAQPLFIRHGRSVRMTDAGRDYQRSVAKSLEHLEAGYHRLEPFRKPGSVVIYAPRDFAARWLMPKLHMLRQAVPTCDPWIDATGKEVDFDEMEVSIAIQRRAEPDPKLEHICLAKDVLTPMVAPSAMNTNIFNRNDLLKYALLHVERNEDWEDWFSHFGETVKNISAGINFSDSDLALGAAERGMGVALGTLSLAKEAISKGSLICPLADCVETNQAWFAVSTAKELSDSITARVWQWLNDNREMPSK